MKILHTFGSDLMTKKLKKVQSSPGKLQEKADNGPSREDKVAEFLKSGGKIQQIPTGVSGQEKLTGRKHITLGNKSNK